MRPRSPDFDAAVRRSHEIAVRVDVFYNRAPVAQSLDLVDGSVTLDRTAAQRGRCSVTLAEPLMIPTPTGGLLTPYGYELSISRGVRYPSGVVEAIPLGVFPIQTSALDGVTRLTAIEGIDRSQMVVDARLEDAVAIDAGTNYATAIRTIIDNAVPGLTYTFTPTTYTTPALVFEAQADRWEVARNMATSIGCELFFDGTGACVLRPEPTFSAVPAWTLSEGEGGLLVGAALAMDRGPAYNRVVATGENTSLTIVPRGVWTDDDPSSPTYYGGGFGHKPRFFASAFITTDAQAVSAAAAIGTAQKGVARSLALSAVPNPALEPGDLVLVKRDAIGVNEVHIIDALTFGLTADAAMSGASRWGSVAA
jgi:hypothetical protein